MNEIPAPQLLWGIINSNTLARCVQVIAEFGVADALSDRPMSAAELAAQTGMNADALRRMLRLLAAHNVFEENGESYQHTPASHLLRTDHPHSLRSLARMMNLPIVLRSFADLPNAARTGKPTLDWAGLVDYFGAHVDESNLFNQAMSDKSGTVVPAVLDAYDFSPFHVIADVGGGRGHLLRSILERTPSASGILFDLPHVIADASRQELERLHFQPGEVFNSVLPTADVYLLMEVLHDWTDEDAAKILAAARRVAPAHARLLVVEALVSDTPGPHISKVLDVIMLAVTGGRERTASEYEALLAGAGFGLERVIPTSSPYSIVEAIAV